jgi:serine/threonine protein kinase
MFDEESEEDPRDYRRGGYHPIQLGDSYSSNRYKILQKLGWGHFSTVWLAKDSVKNIAVALKIVKSASHYTETALDEIKLLQKVASGSDPYKQFVVELKDSFRINGPNGSRIFIINQTLQWHLKFWAQIY